MIREIAVMPAPLRFGSDALPYMLGGAIVFPPKVKLLGLSGRNTWDELNDKYNPFGKPLNKPGGSVVNGLSFNGLRKQNCKVREVDQACAMRARAYKRISAVRLVNAPAGMLVI